MTEFNLPHVKDLGTKREVMDALPYAVVGGVFDGTLSNNIATGGFATILNYIVPAGQQLKILFLRVFTSDANGALFSIFETHPALVGQTGVVEAFPVVGSTPAGYRDYPFLEAQGAEVLHGSLRDPVHVCEGSIDFRLMGFQAGPNINEYGLTFWGVVSNENEAP